ncbi:MAG: DUF937 domain-containing protein [Treponema sp.]|nr:DUF937 domain-containing protein [Treponema sp.]
MDASTLLSGLVSASNVKKIGTASGASSADVKNVLGQALPVLLQSASGQAKGATAAGFTQALADHASAKTSSIDMADGAKIISHLLGKNQNTTTTQIAKAAGVTKASASSILSAAAPLFMNLLGKQTDGASGSALTGLLSGLVSNIDVGSLLGNLLGGTSTASTTTSTGKKKKKTDSSSTGSSLLNGVMNLLK